MHDGAGCEASLVAAVATFKHAGAGLKTPRITGNTASRTFEAPRPPDPFQVVGAGLLIGEALLELQQAPRIVWHAQDRAPEDQPVSTG